jgi:uncharacterized SAM-binding protein YcdF (DUF218 family)
MVDLKAFFFKIRYQWTAAYDSLHITRYHYLFWSFFLFFFFLVRCSSCILFVYICCTLSFSIKFQLFIQKKKKPMILTQNKKKAIPCPESMSSSHFFNYKTVQWFTSLLLPPNICIPRILHGFNILH